MYCDLVVIGGGSAGMMAAGKAAFAGARVVLVEKQKQCGSKILLTGNGRCNVTNSSQRLQFQQKVVQGAHFLEMALKHFSPNKFLIFLEGLGLSYEIEDDTRVFPRSENGAVEMRNCLLSWLKQLDVTILTDTSVKEIHAPLGLIEGVDVVRKGVEERITTKAVIVATGGMSYPETGSTGDGYHLASHLGHTIVPPTPALVPIQLGERKQYAALQGVALQDIRLYLWHEEKKIIDCRGGILFTHFGISGPAVLDISRSLAMLMSQGKTPILTIDFLPAMDEGDLEILLTDQFHKEGKKLVKSVLRELVPLSCVEHILSCTPELSSDLTGAKVSVKMRKILRKLLKRHELPLIGTLGIERATVTAGGISLEEVNAKTMGSYNCQGLFFAGEVMNVDAACGGYNLHIAWSTGRLAGMSAAEYIRQCDSEIKKS